MKTDLQKNGKPKFKTLDSTIITEDSQGRREDTGRRVEEVNNEMAVAMGVSKSILNNVVFCHQEDSNWPLEEGQKLKTKFDEIFGTTDYNKAIDKFIKLRKGYEDKLKEFKINKVNLESKKKTADHKTTALEVLKQKHDSLERRSQELETEIVEVEEQMAKLATFMEKAGKLHGEKVVKESAIETLSANSAKLRTKIKTLMDCHVDELEDKLKTFLETQKENVRKLDDLRAEYKRIDEEKKNVDKQTIEGTSELGVMDTKLGEQKVRISERFQAIGKLCEQLGIQINTDQSSQTMDDNDLSSFFSRIECGIVDIEDRLSKAKANADKQDLDFQQQIDKIREDKVAAETNLVTHRQRITKLERDIKEKRSEIASIETSMPAFNKLRDDIKNAAKNLARLKTETNLDDMEKNRNALEIEKNELEDKQHALEADEEKLDSISQVVNELTAKENELSKDQGEFDRLKNKTASTIKHLFAPRVVDRNFKDEVQSLSNSLKTEVQDMKNSLDETRRIGNRLQTERDHKRTQLKQKESELKDTRDRIYHVCDGRDYMDFLTQQKEKVDKLNLELAFHKSSESIYGKYIQDIGQDPCCPLCHKNFQGNETENLKGKQCLMNIEDLLTPHFLIHR